MSEEDYNTILGEKPFKLDALIALDYPPIDYLVERLIPEESITILSAKPASFKTWLVYDMAIRVAAGEKFLNKFNVKKTKVLIVDGEAGNRQLRDRFIKLGAASHSEAIFCKSALGGAKFCEKEINELVKYCKEYKIGLVIFDSLARFIGVKDENNSMEVAKALGQYSRFKANGISVVFIAHSRKNNQFGGGGLDSIRGSSDIGASCDICININRGDDNTITISQSKNRFDEEINPFMAQLKKESDSTSVWYYLGESQKKNRKTILRDAIVSVLTETGELNQKTINEKLTECSLGANPKTVRKVLDEMVEGGLLSSKSGSRSEKLYSLKGEE